MLYTRKPLTETQVLKRLGAQDFRSIHKDKLMEFVSMLPNMDPEVAKAAIAQFPELASAAKESLALLKDTVDKTFEKDSESLQECYSSINALLDSLNSLLMNNCETFEEKEFILNQMHTLIEKKNQLHREYMTNNLKKIAVVGVGIGGALALLNNALGGNTTINIPKKKD